jgi:hypothetical protein
VSGQGHWATVHIETDGAVYVGRVLVSSPRRRFAQVLRDSRPFLFMTEVSINDSDWVEPLVAVNKAFIRRTRVLDEGAGPAALLGL